MSEWKEYQLEQIMDIGSSKRIFYKEYVKSGIPFYRSKEIIEKHNKKQVSTELHITKEKYDEIKHKFGVPAEGDIILTSVGTLGIPYLVTKEDKFYFKDGNLTWFKNYKFIIYNHFFFYWLISPLGKESLGMITIGSTQAALTIRGLKGIKIILPPRPEQKAIAEVLSSLDDKIDLLHRQNKTLEQMAETLFRQWFIEEADEDWEEGVLGDFITPKKGKNITKRQAINGPYPVIAGGLEPSCYHNKSNTLSPVITISASGANAGFVKLHFSPVWSSDSSYIDESITDNIFYYYMFLKTNQAEIFNKQEGSAQPHIYPRHLMELDTLKVPDKLINKFDITCQRLYAKVKANTANVEILENLRDTLLPKLMSGEAKVK